MGNQPYTEVSAAEALKFFRSASITVQEAKAVKIKGEDGKTRDGYATRDVALAEKHVLSAKAWPGNRITITTVDGRRHEATGTIEAAPAGGDKK